MSTEEKYKILKSIVWDYNAEQLSLDKLISGDINSIDEYEFKFILNRMLERLNWYELIDILGIDILKKLLTPETINKLRNKELRERYERIRRILYKESLPFTGWDPEYRKRIKATVLSHRWDRS
ncbi:MAG: hypothetical protein HUU44_05445 [Ignavibacteriaceae bacterium]|nr:hypothetical protein [Ignavibacteriaceae bacterium]